MSEGYFDFENHLNEVRVRAGRACSVTVDGKSITLSSSVTGDELAQSLRLMCRDSVYAYSETLREGFVTLSGGYRVGVGGRAVYEQGLVVGVTDITSLCVRIPHSVAGAGDFAVDIWRKMKVRRGMLVYSPPGNGKTTMLKDIAVQLSSGGDAIRVCVVDTREELDTCGGRLSHLDVLKGYDKAKGIEIATRSLSPELIICDEIGGYEEAMAILDVQSCGVPLVASVHGDSVDEIMKRDTVSMLAKSGIFGAYIGVKREKDRFFHTVDYPEI